jgi:hypothetical protein
LRCIAHDVRASDDDGVQPREISSEFILNHEDAAGGRAGDECVSRIARSELANIHIMKAVYVLGRHDGLRNRLFVEVVR